MAKANLIFWSTLVFFGQTCYAIKCYQCNTFNSYDCRTGTCEAGMNGACFTQETYATGISNMPATGIQRGCMPPSGSLSLGDQCFENRVESQPGMTARTCICRYYDYCNAGDALKMNFKMMLLAPILLFIVIFIQL